MFPSYRHPSVDLGGVSSNIQSIPVNYSIIVQEGASFVCYQINLKTEYKNIFDILVSKNQIAQNSLKLMKDCGHK